MCGAVRLNFAQGASGGLGDRHGRRLRLVLAPPDRDAGGSVRPPFDIAPGQCRGFLPSQTAVRHGSDDR